ncbi:esterase-like activity of phytase family protein [Enterobacter bugandensis]|uniref:esterase-like activity of phytase family protein n=1 Tax=Enterobacter bugandensis TaxID=881260 RepID=UPI0007B3D2CF|nr:esterase-like activity of phytase family protein [Enterobacter bugandensis]
MLKNTSPKIILLVASLSILNVNAAESRLKFLNEYELPTTTIYQDVQFGGLSGIVRNEHNDLYYAISDARNTKAEGQSRFYTLKIAASESGIDKIDIVGMTELVDSKGISFKEQEVDGEGIALSPDAKSLLWVSELGSPLRKSGFDGQLQADFANKIPEYYNGGGDLKNAQHGLRSGLSFEGISVSPGGNYLFIAAESALKQDGEISTTTQSTPVRIMKYTLSENGDVGELVGEFVYNVDPIPQVTRFGVSDNGLTEVLALSDDKLLVVERSGRNASEGFNDFDFSIKSYIADLSNATNIIGKSSLSDVDNKKTFQPVAKKLLIDFDDYTSAPDCIEGVTFGPQIKGMKSLIFVSDNNFQPYQTNKFYMFLDEKGLLK